MFPNLRIFIWVVAANTYRALEIVLRNLRAGYWKITLDAVRDQTQRSIVSFRHELKSSLENVASGEGSDPLRRLHKVTLGLHSLLKSDEYSYSILIPVYRPEPKYFREALRSAVEQSAPNLEVLVGFDGEQPLEVRAVVDEFKKSHPRGNVLRLLERLREDGGGISRTTNFLARQAKGKFLLLMDHDDWIRPDLLFRYEQTLRLLGENHSRVLYCDEFKIDECGREVAGSRLRKPLVPPFPYVFINFVCHCLLVPKALWNSVGGLRPETDGAQDYDLSMRLFNEGAKFHNVPFFLYAWRVHQASTAMSIGAKSYVLDAGLRAVSDFVKDSNLPWDIVPSETPTAYRAIPVLIRPVPITAIVLFRELKEMTLKCVRALLSQTQLGQPSSTWLSIVAVDNGSEDLSIGNALQALGVRILRVDEPFNFSRLNNLAVASLAKGVRDSEEALLFINNDVELDQGALEEMARWVHQPKVGVVGCQLRYPGGNIQHGGVMFDDMVGSPRRMNWAHQECGLSLEQASWSQLIRVTDAVTAACCLMSRRVFESVGQFDEVFYPIAYSDTDLCLKLQQMGFYCLYTPYAKGVHSESESRGKRHIEDVEGSRWMAELASKSRKLPFELPKYGVRGFRNFSDSGPS